MTQVKNVIKDNYNMMLLNDFLREEIKEAGFNKLEISKSDLGIGVFYVSIIAENQKEIIKLIIK